MTQTVATGDRVKEVVAQEAQRKNTLPTASPSVEWVRQHIPTGGERSCYDKVSRVERERGGVKDESAGEVRHTLGYPMQYGEGKELARAQRNLTVAADGVAAGLSIHADLAY